MLCLYYTYSEYLIHRYFVFVTTDEREWRTVYGTANWVLVYFNSVIKRVKQCCCALILLPKSSLNANLTTTNRFFTNDDWQRGRFENFESDHQHQSNLESDVRFEIESNHEASQVPNLLTYTHTYEGKFERKDTMSTWEQCILLYCLLWAWGVVYTEIDSLTHFYMGVWTGPADPAGDGPVIGQTRIWT